MIVLPHRVGRRMRIRTHQDHSRREAGFLALRGSSSRIGWSLARLQATKVRESQNQRQKLSFNVSGRSKPAAFEVK
jgi:hypothetical protein